MIYTDQLGRKIEFLDTPKRLVSLVPSQTELLVDLGLKNSIVGVTKFCVHPNDIRKEKTIVGGTKKVDFEKIKKLNPDIILCNKEENTKDIVESLQKEFVVHVSDIFSTKDALEMILQYGMIFKKQDEAKELIYNIKSEEKSFSDFIINIPRKKVAYFIWKDPWIVVGNNTFIDHLLDINGFTNVFGHESRYPEVSLNQLKDITNLDLILLSSEPYPFSEKHIDEIQKINPNVKIILVDGEYFSWYGSRLATAFSYFKTLH